MSQLNARMDKGYRPMLAVQYIDEIAKTNPSRLLCMIPKGKDPRDGFHNITFGHFTQAVNHLAWHLESNLGEKDSFKVFGFISHPADFRYQLLTFAASKIRWVSFFTSPRNSMVAHLSLLDQANCNTWLIDEKSPPVVSDMGKQHPLKLISIPTEEFYLNTNFDGKVAHYPYGKSYEQGRRDVFAIWHSSGSTGIPKVIHIRHSLFCAPHALKLLPDSNFQHKYFRGLKMFITLPWFHAAAYYMTFGSSMYYDVVTVVAPAAPITAELVDLYHQFADVDISVVAPSILQDLAGNDSYAANCKRLKYIANGGGPSTTEVGEILSKYTHPINVGGATETGLWLTEMLDAEDFMYWKMDPMMGTDFRPLDQEHFELWLVRDPVMRDYQPVFDTFGHLREWSTKDIYVKHPTKRNLWKLVGRTDDVIVLSTGEKVNSVTIEGDICQHPHISGAVAFGEGRFELGILLEVLPENVENVKRNIEPLLTQINSSSVAHGRISKDMVLISSSDRPFPRAGKGTIQKKMCLELYKKDINDVYLRQDQAATSKPAPGHEYESIAEFLSGWITTETGRSPESRDQDMCESGYGLDSLSVVRLSRELDRALPGIQVLPQTIYANPTISRLAAFLTGKSTSFINERPNREQQMDKMLLEFSKYLPLNMRPPIPTKNDLLTIAVTGSTGSLGSFVLQSLLKKRPQVAKIYCLNRRSKEEIIKSGAISANDLQDIELLKIDISQPRLGLSNKSYAELAQNVDIFIHNAWDVNFNKSLDSFQSQIHGLRQLIDLASSSWKGASLHFMSTISTVSRWQPDSRHEADDHHTAVNGDGVDTESKVPEKLHTDWKVSMNMGYAESKQISELLLAQACEECNIPAAIYRIGQIAGSVSGSAKDGVWQPHEWVPTLIRTSVTMGVFPSDLGWMTEVDWIPVDVLSDVLVELVLDKKSRTGDADSESPTQNLKIFHTVNPQTTNWSALLPTILESVSKPTETVPLHEWVDLVRRASTDEDAKVRDLPAVKIMWFFEDMARTRAENGVRLSTGNTCASSKTLSTLEAIKPEWMQLWMRQWNF